MTTAEPIRRDFYVYAYYRDGIPIYVGKGCGNRWVRYPSQLKHNIHLYRLVMKDRQEGTGRITRGKIAEGLCAEAAYDLEVATIAKIGRRPVGPLVNQTDGGEGVRNMSAEARAAIGAANRARVFSPETLSKMSADRRGKVKSPEHREKIRQASTGVVFSPERIAKIAAASRGRIYLPARGEKISAAHKGRPKSEAHREAMRESHRRRREARIATQSLEHTNGRYQKDPSSDLHRD